jgi:hypothetical protein
MENEKNNKIYSTHPTEEVDYSYVQENIKISIEKSQKEYERLMNNEDTHRLVRKTDSIVDHVVDKFISRASFGKQKYNNTMDRTDLSIDEWLEHAIEEHMDAILYLNKIKKELSGKI